MDTVNWLQLGFALALGLLVGAAILGAGIWIDKAQERRWNRELQGTDADKAVGPITKMASRFRYRRGA
jgi:hypothetical protein